MALVDTWCLHSSGKSECFGIVYGVEQTQVSPLAAVLGSRPGVDSRETREARITESTITVYGAHWCPDCRRSKQFLGEHQIPYSWVDIEQGKTAEAHVIAQNNGKRIIPTIEFADGSILIEPSNAELATKLGLKTTAERSHYELIIIGGGNSATEEGLFLLNFAERVTMLVRGDKLTASQILKEKALGDPRIEVRFNTEVVQLEGKGGELEALTVKNNQTGASETFNPAGVFVFVGLTPNAGFLKDTPVHTNAWDFIVTGHELVHDGERPQRIGDQRPWHLCRRGRALRQYQASGLRCGRRGYGGAADQRIPQDRMRFHLQTPFNLRQAGLPEVILY